MGFHEAADGGQAAIAGQEGAPPSPGCGRDGGFLPLVESEGGLASLASGMRILVGCSRETEPASSRRRQPCR